MSGGGGDKVTGAANGDGKGEVKVVNVLATGSVDQSVKVGWFRSGPTVVW